MTTHEISTVYFRSVLQINDAVVRKSYSSGTILGCDPSIQTPRIRSTHYQWLAGLLQYLPHPIIHLTHAADYRQVGQDDP